VGVTRGMFGCGVVVVVGVVSFGLVGFGSLVVGLCRLGFGCEKVLRM
jgi:hypothetical protein